MIQDALVGTSQTPDSLFYIKDPIKQWLVHYSILSKYSWDTSKVFQSLTDASELTDNNILSSGWETSCHTTSLWEENTPTH